MATRLKTAIMPSIASFMGGSSASEVFFSRRSEGWVGFCGDPKNLLETFNDFFWGFLWVSLFDSQKVAFVFCGISLSLLLICSCCS